MSRRPTLARGPAATLSRGVPGPARPLDVNGEQLLGVLWKRRLTLALTFLATLGAAAAVTFTLPKAYTTVAYVWVSATETPDSDFEATQLTQVLTRTYAELLDTRNMAEEVAERLPFEASPTSLQGAVEVAAPEQSQLLAIEAESSSPRRAQRIANSYAAVLVDRARDLTVRGATNSRVTLAEPAPLVTSPSRPQPFLYLLVGAFVAAFAAAAAGLLRERFDQRIQVDSATTELLGLPILGRIPRSSASAAMALVRQSDSPTARSSEEAFRLLVVNLTFVSLGRRPTTLAVVSANQGEGKSTCSANIARAAAGIGSDVLLVDGDLRKPSLTTQLAAGLPSSGGFSNLLLGAGDLSEAAIEIFRTVRFVPAGPLPPNPTALLGPDLLGSFENAVRDQFDLVVYDTPPLAIGADASLIAGQAQGTILVVDASRARRDSVVQAVTQLERAQAKVLGVVLNRAREAPRSYYYDDSNGSAAPGARRRRLRDRRMATRKR